MSASLSRSLRSFLRRLSPSPPSCSRSFSAAVQYDTEWEYSDSEDEDSLKNMRSAPLAAATWREEEGRGVQWVFMGSPGAKKHLYASRLAELLEVPYISMGTLVRQELDPTSSLYIKIANAVNEGKLVPEDIIFGLLAKRLEEGQRKGESGFILDGIPRTRVQAEILDQIVDIDLVVNFKQMEDSLVKKHIGTHICSHCHKSFNVSDSESTSLNPCLATRTHHSLLKSSAALDHEVNVERFRAFSEQTKLLEEYYRKQKKLLDFHTARGPRETWHGLLAALHLQHIDAVSTSQKLTM